jgi:hypothetical protein
MKQFTEETYALAEKLAETDPRWKAGLDRLEAANAAVNVARHKFDVALEIIRRMENNMVEELEQIRVYAPDCEAAAPELLEAGERLLALTLALNSGQDIDDSAFEAIDHMEQAIAQAKAEGR